MLCLCLMYWNIWFYGVTNVPDMVISFASDIVNSTHDNRSMHVMCVNHTWVHVYRRHKNQVDSKDMFKLIPSSMIYSHSSGFRHIHISLPHGSGNDWHETGETHDEIIANINVTRPQCLRNEWMSVYLLTLSIYHEAYCLSRWPYCLLSLAVEDLLFCWECILLLRIFSAEYALSTIYIVSVYSMLMHKILK